MKIISIDPGGSTGLCIAEESTQKQSHTITARATLRGEHHVRLMELLLQLEPDVIVYEKFVHVQNKRGVDYSAPEYIGVIKLYEQKFGPVTMVPQLPAKQGPSTLWTDDKLKVLSLWMPGKDHKDEMSATKHMLNYLTQELKETYYFNLLKLMGSFDG